MKIDDIYQQIGLINHSKGSANSKESAIKDDVVPGSQPEQKPDTQVDLSPTSKEISKVAAVVEKDSPERTERVSEIKAKIVEGKYEVDSREVANKILKEALFDFLKR